MSDNINITINGESVEAGVGSTLLEVCKNLGVDIPTMCHFKGLTDVGACRLCLVEVEGIPKLLPACMTKVTENMIVQTHTERLVNYRRMIVEMFFAERNHVCSVCVANNHCELQDLGYKVGMTHVRFPYLFPACDVDGSHKDYVLDHNRCIMCTRCVRVCSEVEGAANWDVMGRGHEVRVISDFNTPWGDSVTCTSCGKCVHVCPTGTIWPKDHAQGQSWKEPEKITDLIEKRSLAL